jgi:hypothetical protein
MVEGIEESGIQKQGLGLGLGKGETNNTSFYSTVEHPQKREKKQKRPMNPKEPAAHNLFVSRKVRIPLCGNWGNMDAETFRVREFRVEPNLAFHEALHKWGGLGHFALRKI